eukprot:4361718-Pleurochrysis_carterae.AAC.3
MHFWTSTGGEEARAHCRLRPVSHERLACGPSPLLHEHANDWGICWYFSACRSQVAYTLRSTLYICLELSSFERDQRRRLSTAMDSDYFLSKRLPFLCSFSALLELDPIQDCVEVGTHLLCSLDARSCAT